LARLRAWKKHGARTKLHQRQLHGQEGRGRFKAFALGSAVDWKTTYERDGKVFSYKISILEHEIRRVSVSDEAPAKGRAPIGVTRRCQRPQGQLRISGPRKLGAFHAQRPAHIL
jgi:hypothetical protein